MANYWAALERRWARLMVFRCVGGFKLSSGRTRRMATLLWRNYSAMMRTLKSVQRNQIALGAVLLVQTLIIFLAALPGNPSQIYEADHVYLWSLGILDAANDRNFHNISRIASEEIASKFVACRILVTNFVLLFSVANLFFLPFFLDYLVGRHFRGRDIRLHVIFFAFILFLGLALFLHANLNGDYFFIEMAPPDYADFPSNDRWWVMYALAQSVVVFWSGLVVSIVVVVAKSLFDSVGIFRRDA